MEAIWGVLFGVVLFSILLGAGVLGLTVWLVVKAVRAIRRRLSGGTVAQPKLDEPMPTRRATHEAYRHQDVDRGSSAASITEVMQEYVDDGVVGPYARDVIDVLDAAEHCGRSLTAAIDNEFERNSMSWDRFSATADQALDAILRNCAVLANRVQSFDVVDYRRMEEFYQTGGFRTHGTPEEARLQRWKLLDETKREMDGIRVTNQNLLLELSKLVDELTRLSSAEAQDEGERIADEVSKLVDETKYYR